MGVGKDIGKGVAIASMAAGEGFKGRAVGRILFTGLSLKPFGGGGARDGESIVGLLAGYKRADALFAVPVTLGEHWIGDT